MLLQDIYPKIDELVNAKKISLETIEYYCFKLVFKILNNVYIFNKE